MKRVLSLLLALAVLLAAPLRAYAAEITEDDDRVRYFFYPSEITTYSDSFEFSPDGAQIFIYEDLLPDGVYKVSFWDGSEYYYSQEISITFQRGIFGDVDFGFIGDLHSENLPDLTLRMVYLDGTTQFVFSINGQILNFGDSCDVVYFDRVTEDSDVITLEDVQQIRDDIIHADLFGAFLICGTLVGAVLFRRWHR